MSYRILVMIALLAAVACQAAEKPHWTYSGEAGPQAWATLCAEYGDCAGHNQSPIDLAGFVEADLAPLALAYQPGGREILNNGHTVQVNYAPGSTLTVDGIPFELKQFHFHSPSENRIDGTAYAMEIHLVHAAADGELAVVALMVANGAANADLATLWSAMPEAEGVKKPLAGGFDVSRLLPADRAYYRFNGSLTTPPCTEGVRWFVMQSPITASGDQVGRFTAVMKHPNNRPVQPRNARLVLK